jgi:hypothetical protein
MQEMSAGEAVLYKQIRKAMKGDQTAFDLVMRQAQRHRLLRETRHENSRGPRRLVTGMPMSVEEWEETARKQQAASKIASEKFFKEWFDE